MRSQREVAVLLREGRLTVIDQQPIVGRVIEQIMAAGAPEQVAVDLALG